MDNNDQQVRNLKVGMDICTKTVSAVVSMNLNNPTGLEAGLGALRKTMKGYIIQEYEYLDRTTALDKARSKLRNMTDEAREKHGEGGVLGLFRTEEEKLKKRGNSAQKPDKHNAMIAFEEEVMAQKRKQGVIAVVEASDGGDDDDEDGEELVMTQTTGATLDPITRKPMTDPVKNTLCGHSYERTSIQALTRKGKKTKCPIAGCPNDQFVLMDHLIDDTDLKRQIERSKRN